MSENKKLVRIGLWFFLCAVYSWVLLCLMPRVLEHFIGKLYYINSLFVLSLLTFLVSKFLSGRKKIGNRMYFFILFLDLLSLGGIQGGVAAMIPNATCKVIFTFIIGGLFFWLTLNEYFRNTEK